MVYLKLFLTAVFWGGTFIAGRTVVQELGPYSAAFLRFLLASLLLGFLTIRREKRLPGIDRRQIVPIILLGLTGVFLYNVFFFSGLRLIHAGRAALIIANNPIFITLLSAIFLKERLSPLRTMGVLLSVSGAIVVISRGSPASLFQGGFGWGEAAILGCVGSWGTYTLIGRHVINRLSPLTAVTAASLVGTILLLPPALGEGLLRQVSGLTGVGILCLLYLAICGTVIGFVWYYEGVLQIGPTRAGLFINFVPVSAVIMAYLILGEPITPSLISGTLLVCTGVYLTNSRK